MTHDELLAKIEMVGTHLQTGDNPYLDALRAVVELHIRVLDPVGRPECLSCRRHYPCPTIKAIEKELI